MICDMRGSESPAMVMPANIYGLLARYVLKALFLSFMKQSYLMYYKKCGGCLQLVFHMLQYSSLVVLCNTNSPIDQLHNKLFITGGLAN